MLPYWEDMMRLIGRKKIFDLGLNTLLNNWLAEIKDANWKAKNELILQYPRLISLDNDVFLYPVDNGSLQVEFVVAFTKGVLMIKGVRNHG